MCSGRVRVQRDEMIKGENTQGEPDRCGGFKTQFHEGVNSQRQRGQHLQIDIIVGSLFEADVELSEGIEYYLRRVRMRGKNDRI